MGGGKGKNAQAEKLLRFLRVTCRIASQIIFITVSHLGASLPLAYSPCSMGHTYHQSKTRVGDHRTEQQYKYSTVSKLALT